MSYTIEYLDAAHKHSAFHFPEIQASKLCACFSCLGMFSPNEIQDWTDEDDPRGKTAICPKCFDDAVLGSASGYPVDDTNFLKAMNDKWF